MKRSTNWFISCRYDKAPPPPKKKKKKKKKERKKRKGRRWTAWATKKNTKRIQIELETSARGITRGRRAIDWHNLVYNLSSEKFGNLSLHGIGP